MKVSLVVAEGVHQGKVIPITANEFLIGRDPHCQLRPASPAVSKQHCGFLIRDGKVYVRDYGSTNGTFVNNEQVAGERELAPNDHIKAGPLEFRVRIESPATTNPTAKPAAVAQTAAAQAEPTPAATATAEPEASGEPDADQLAAMLLGMDDDSPSGDRTAEQGIPDGTTVMELPAVPEGGEGKPDAKKPSAPTPDSSSAAAALLQKYMRRPRT